MGEKNQNQNVLQSIRSNYRTAIIIFIIALALRIMFVGLKPDLDNNLRLDSHQYKQIAHNLAIGNGFSMDGEKPTTFRAPLYPVFIMGCYKVFGENNLVVKLVQAVIGALTVLLIFWTMILLFNPRVGVLGSLMVAVHPELVALTAFLYSETVFIFLLVAAVLLTVIAARMNDLWLFMLSGIAWGLGTLCRGILLPIPVFIFLALLFMRVGWKRAFIWSASAGLLLGLSVLPWTIRNYNVTHQFVAVSEGMGVSFWQGNYLPFDGRYRYEETLAAMRQAADGLAGPAADKKLTQVTIENMKTYPVQSAWLIVRKVGRFWFEVYENSPSGAQRNASSSIVFILGAWHYALLLLGLVGLAVFRRCSRELGMIYMIFVFMTLVHAMNLSVPRYRLPVEPYVCAFSAAGLYWIWMKCTHRIKGLSGHSDV